MKMKDVCVKTGLTERAVRFYADKDLIHPKKTKVNGRENWEFDENLCPKYLYELMEYKLKNEKLI